MIACYSSRLILTCIATFFTILESFSQQQYNTSVHFTSNNHQLSARHKQDLNGFLDSLHNIPEAFCFSITGHTDNIGGKDFNHSLSYKRAWAVANYLQAKGYKQQQMQLSGKGFNAPIASNNTDEGKELNRRVDVQFTLALPNLKGIAGVQNTPEFLTIDAIKGGRVIAASGAIISVPPSIFKDDKGNIVTGPVTIGYTEYRDAIDFLISGIPMHYQSEHGLMPFNSAGMFTINASQNGKQLSLLENKQLKVDFKYNKNIPDLSFYRFDTSTNKWTALQALSNTSGDNMRGETGSVLPKSICRLDSDYEKVFLVYSGLRYANNNDSSLTRFVRRKKISDELQQAVAAQAKYEKQSQSLLKQYRLDIVKQSRFFGKEKFKIYQVKGKQDYASKMLDNISFHKKFPGSYIDSLYNLSFQQFSIDEKGGSYTLTFFSGTKKTTFENVLVKLEERKKKKPAEVIEDLNSRSRSYKNQVTKVRDSLLAFTKKINTYNSELRSLDSYTRKMSNDSLVCFQQLNQQLMSAEEKMLSFDDWLLYFDQHKSEMNNRFTMLKSDPSFTISDANVKRTANAATVVTRDGAIQQYSAEQLGFAEGFSLSSLGTYNCDQLYRLNNPVELYVNYETSKGEQVRPVIAFILDNNLNGLLRFDGDYGRSPYHITYSAASLSRMVVIDAAGQSWSVKSTAFNGVDPKRSKDIYTLVAEPIKKSGNKLQLKSSLGM
jgi:hypothetical protein